MTPPETRPVALQFASTALAILGGLSIAVGAFTLYALDATGDEPAVAARAAGQAGAMGSAGVFMLYLAATSFRDGSRGAWWTVLLGGGVLALGFAWSQLGVAGAEPNYGLTAAVVGLWLAAVLPLSGRVVVKPP